MADISHKFDEPSIPTGKCYITLDADKALVPWGDLIPLTWSGSVCGRPVRIVQNSLFSSGQTGFEFEVFPLEFDHLQGEIVNLIDGKLRILD